MAKMLWLYITYKGLKLFRTSFSSVIEYKLYITYKGLIRIDYTALRSLPYNLLYLTLKGIQFFSKQKNPQRSHAEDSFNQSYAIILL